MYIYIYIYTCSIVSCVVMTLTMTKSCAALIEAVQEILGSQFRLWLRLSVCANGCLFIFYRCPLLP